MAIGVQVWSQVPVTNATADSNINWAEGMAPSQVNDSARSLMGSVAKWRDDNNGTLVTAGTTVAATVQTNQVEAALTAGYTIKVMFAATLDSSPTLAVDGLAAKPLQMCAGISAPIGSFPAGTIQSFTYSTTGTGQWIAEGGIGVTSTSTIPIFTALTNSLAANVTGVTTNYSDGPVISFASQGTSGVWFASGTVSLFDATAARDFNVKLWDGSTGAGGLIASCRTDNAAANFAVSASLSGIITNPSSAIRMSVSLGAGASGQIRANGSGASTGTGADSTLTVVRIG